jgi:hypothetical protein
VGSPPVLLEVAPLAPVIIIGNSHPLSEQPAALLQILVSGGHLPQSPSLSSSFTPSVHLNQGPAKR